MERGYGASYDRRTELNGRRWSAMEDGLTYGTTLRQHALVGALGLTFGLVVLFLLAAAVVSATSWDTVLLFDRNGEIRHPTVAESARGALVLGLLAIGVAVAGVITIRRVRRTAGSLTSAGRDDARSG